jgi:hypothetical protein
MRRWEVKLIACLLPLHALLNQGQCFRWHLEVPREYLHGEALPVWLSCKIGVNLHGRLC